MVDIVLIEKNDHSDVFACLFSYLLKNSCDTRSNSGDNNTSL